MPRDSVLLMSELSNTKLSDSELLQILRSTEFNSKRISVDAISEQNRNRFIRLASVAELYRDELQVTIHGKTLLKNLTWLAEKIFGLNTPGFTGLTATDSTDVSSMGIESNFSGEVISDRTDSARSTDTDDRTQAVETKNSDELSASSKNLSKRDYKAMPRALSAWNITPLLTTEQIEQDAQVIVDASVPRVPMDRHGRVLPRFFRDIKHQSTFYQYFQQVKSILSLEKTIKDILRSSPSIEIPESQQVIEFDTNLSEVDSIIHFYNNIKKCIPNLHPSLICYLLLGYHQDAISPRRCEQFAGECSLLLDRKTSFSQVLPALSCSFANGSNVKLVVDSPNQIRLETFVGSSQSGEIAKSELLLRVNSECDSNSLETLDGYFNAFKGPDDIQSLQKNLAALANKAESIRYYDYGIFDQQACNIDHVGDFYQDFWLLAIFDGLEKNGTYLSINHITALALMSPIKLSKETLDEWAELAVTDQVQLKEKINQHLQRIIKPIEAKASRNIKLSLLEIKWIKCIASIDSSYTACATAQQFLVDNLQYKDDISRSDFEKHFKDQLPTNIFDHLQKLFTRQEELSAVIKEQNELIEKNRNERKELINLKNATTIPSKKESYQESITSKIDEIKKLETRCTQLMAEKNDVQASLRVCSVYLEAFLKAGRPIDKDDSFLKAINVFPKAYLATFVGEALATGIRTKKSFVASVHYFLEQAVMLQENTNVNQLIKQLVLTSDWIRDKVRYICEQNIPEKRLIKLEKSWNKMLGKARKSMDTVSGDNQLEFMKSLTTINKIALPSWGHYAQFIVFLFKNSDQYPLLKPLLERLVNHEMRGAILRSPEALTDLLSTRADMVVNMMAHSRKARRAVAHLLKNDMDSKVQIGGLEKLTSLPTKIMRRDGMVLLFERAGMDSVKHIYNQLGQHDTKKFAQLMKASDRLFRQNPNMMSNVITHCRSMTLEDSERVFQNTIIRFIRQSGRAFRKDPVKFCDEKLNGIDRDLLNSSLSDLPCWYNASVKRIEASRSDETQRRTVTNVFNRSGDQPLAVKHEADGHVDPPAPQ